MTLAMVSGPISNFISKAGASLPRITVNSSTSRFVSVYSKAIAGLILFNLVDELYDSYKIASSGSPIQWKLKEIKKKIPETVYSVGILAAMYFNPYAGSLLFFGGGLWNAFQTCKHCVSPQFSTSLKWNCLFGKHSSGLLYLFSPIPSRLAGHVTMIALRRFLVMKDMIQFTRQSSLPQLKSDNTKWNWCKSVIVPVVADVACIAVGMKILLNK